MEEDLKKLGMLEARRCDEIHRNQEKVKKLAGELAQRMDRVENTIRENQEENLLPAPPSSPATRLITTVAVDIHAEERQEEKKEK